MTTDRKLTYTTGHFCISLFVDDKLQIVLLDFAVTIQYK